MKIKLIILFSITLFAIKMSAHEMPEMVNGFGEKVIQDYLSFYETKQKKYPILYSAVHLWFEDTDTRRMAASFLNSYADSIDPDTIFFIHTSCHGWRDSHLLDIIPEDTVFGLCVKWLEGGYRSFEADITPFLNEYSKAYWDDLCKWDTVHISKPIDHVVLDGCHYYLVRLIYHNGLLTSAEFCHHEDKFEYHCLWFDPKKVVRVPYPEGKQWPKIF